MEGATIGQYRITGMIGQGGMGAVYAGEHALLGRPAAIKVLLPELSRKQDVVMRFFNEARAATAIRHPGIVEIYDFGWTPDGAAFIVMEHLQGETLAQRASRARFPWPAALAIARQIAGALSAAHAKGIVHRDLKPDNVFLVPDPEVPGGERIKLLDFGIAKLAADSSGASNVTRTGALMGTPTYMAPEQCRGVAVDHRADLYALGCVLYELCCGRPPFVGEGSGDVLAAHIHLPVPSLVAVAADVPAAVEHLVRRLLAKLPADRVQSADELIRAIDALTTDRIAAAAPPRRAVPVATSPSVTTLSGAASASLQVPRPHKRRRWPVAAFSVAMAAISVVVVALVMRGGSDHGGTPQSPAIAPPPSTPSPSPAAREPPGAPQPSPGATVTPPEPRPSPAASQSAPAAPQPPSAAIAGQSAPPTPEPAEPVAPAPAAKQQTADRAPESAAPAGSTPASSAPSSSPAGRAGSPADRAAALTPTTPSSIGRPGAPAAAAPQEPPIIDVTVDSIPPGAQVILDGNVLGTTPFRGTLPRRDRDLRLVLRLAGHADKTVVVRGSRPISEHLKLVRLAPSAPRTKPNRDQSVNPFD